METSETLRQAILPQEVLDSAFHEEIHHYGHTSITIDGLLRREMRPLALAWVPEYL